MHVSEKKIKKLVSSVAVWLHGPVRAVAGGLRAMQPCCHLCQLSVLLPGGHRACHWWQKGNCYGLQLMNEFKLPI